MQEVSERQCHSQSKLGVMLKLCEFSIAVLKHHDQELLGDKKVYLADRLQSIIRESQSRNPEQELEETIKESCLLACSSCFHT